MLTMFFEETHVFPLDFLEKMHDYLPMRKNPNKKIGEFIKQLRKQKGISKKEFAKLLDTSTSYIDAIESGEINFTTAQLLKISEILHRSVISLAQDVSYAIEGGRKLKGTIQTNTSKNGATHLMVASLANKAPTILEDVPRIQEVYRMIEIFESIGVKTKWLEDKKLQIIPPKKYNLDKINKSSASRVRSFIMAAGALSGRVDSFKIPHAGGCKMGERSIMAHKHALKELGIKIETKQDHYLINAKRRHPAQIIMYEASDTATTVALTAAAQIPGKTIIKYAPPNYQVQDVCLYLQKLGVKIKGIGTTTLEVEGLPELNKEVTHPVTEDPIESMFFISLALTTGSKIKITRAPVEFLEVEFLKLRYMNAKISVSKPYLAKNNHTKLVDIVAHPSKLIASPSKIHPLPYPGLNIDNLPFFVPVATQALGTTMIHDWAWENRAIYFTELNRLGANISLADPHRVFITGPTPLKGTQIVCPPALRPSVIILIAMLAAKGRSVLRNVYPIERGYENLVGRLKTLGAKIENFEEL